MAMTLEEVKKINNYVHEKPRSIQDIAHLINHNWRTAESYVNQISSQMGTISMMTFRENTRGAVKIVYWNNTESANMTQAQELLLRKIEIGKKNIDFSPFDIYQYVDKSKRSSFFEENSKEKLNIRQDLVGTLRKAKHQVLIFSEACTWVDLVQEGTKIADVFLELMKKGVHINFLANIDINSANNVKMMLALNEIAGKDMIEVRHCEQPLRAYIIDDKCAKFFESKEPLEKISPKDRKKYIFYEIHDETWVNWMQKVFWRFFSSSIPAKQRIEDLKSVQRM